MSLPGKLRNYRPPVPWIISALLLCAFAVYLAMQIQHGLHLVRASAPTGGGEQAFGNFARPDLQRLETLFGSAAPAPGYAPSASDIGLTLRGSFVHAEPQRSSAIIQLEGQPPRLYWQGEALDSGISLHAVYPDRVEILRNGHVETLHFPQVRPTTYIPDEPPEAYLDEQSPAESQTEDAQLMQQQMDALRQQLEEAVDQTDPAPANDQPTEDD
ncbi:secretion protein XcpP [Pseudomonas sp. BAY1663]|uniref:type II secretion system protein N n=1 Tax=Pseudomonas sp. BAY1663 TaxID=1439940 RepID=UPI00042DE01F|nr:type II secretion system protein N [Pseudomonas sp. BAY1663]EXF47160.1 secretion protein XcpP [Pseudomonas sp. BAY1663]